MTAGRSKSSVQRGALPTFVMDSRFERSIRPFVRRGVGILIFPSGGRCERSTLDGIGCLRVERTVKKEDEQLLESQMGGERSRDRTKLALGQRLTWAWAASNTATSRRTADNLESAIHDHARLQQGAEQHACSGGRAVGRGLWA